MLHIHYKGEQLYSPEKKTKYKVKAAAIAQIPGWKDRQFQNVKNL